MRGIRREPANSPHKGPVTQKMFLLDDVIMIPKLQRWHRWNLGMNKLFHPTLYWGWDYFSMLVSKLIHVSKRDPGLFHDPKGVTWFCHNSRNFLHVLKILSKSFHAFFSNVAGRPAYKQTAISENIASISGGKTDICRFLFSLWRCRWA